MRLLIQPKASKTEFVGPHDGSLKIRVQSPPVDGRANDELVRFLSSLLGIPKRDLEVVKGRTGRTKTLRVAGLNAEMVRVKLGLKPD